MAAIHSDLTGFQRTTPSTASVSSASNMRGERNVLSDPPAPRPRGRRCRGRYRWQRLRHSSWPPPARRLPGSIDFIVHAMRLPVPIVTARAVEPRGATIAMDRSRPAHQNGRRRSHPIGPATCTLGVPSLIALIALAPTSSSAQEGAFARVLQCKNQDARVELYLPTATAHAGDGWQALEKTDARLLRARPLGCRQGQAAGARARHSHQGQARRCRRSIHPRPAAEHRSAQRRQGQLRQTLRREHDLRPGRGQVGAAEPAKGGRNDMTDNDSNDKPTERGFLRGLQNYGDRDFSIYMRRAFAKSMGYTGEELVATHRRHRLHALALQPLPPPLPRAARRHQARRGGGRRAGAGVPDDIAARVHARAQLHEVPQPHGHGHRGDDPRPAHGLRSC